MQNFKFLASTFPEIWIGGGRKISKVDHVTRSLCNVTGDIVQYCKWCYTNVFPIPPFLCVYCQYVSVHIQ